MLLKKLWRDLLKNKVQFLSIFLMSFLGLLIFVGIDSEVAGATAAEYAYYQEQNLADLWVQGKQFTDSDLARIKDLHEVLNAERRLYLEGTTKDFDDEPSFFITFLETNEISKMRVIEGEKYDEGSSGVWIDEQFAKKRNLHVGDTIDIEVDGYTITEEVKGTIYHPEYVYFVKDAAAMMPDYGNYCYALASKKEYPGEIYYNQMVIDAVDINNTDEIDENEELIQRQITEKLKKLLDLETLVVTGKNSNMSYQTFDSEMKQHKSMAVAFPAVFMLISVMGIITTMTRLTSNQRIQIGTLKALGFSRKSIILHYVSYGFFLSLFGSVLGAIVGYYTLPDVILGMFTSTYLMPGLRKGLSKGSVICVMLMVLSSTLITFYAVRKEGKQPPAETLKPAPPKISKPTAIERSRFWQRLDFSIQWNLRDIMRNKARTIMGMVGCMGSAMLIMAAFGCLDSMNIMMEDAYGKINTANTIIVLAEDTPYEVAYDYAKKYDGQMVENVAIEIEHDGIQKTATVRVLEKGNYLHFRNEEKTPIKLDENSISISSRMAYLIGADRGDWVTWHIIGEDDYYRFRVDGIYQDPSVQGITMYRSTFEQLDIKFSPTEILTNFSVDSSLSDDDAVVGINKTSEAMDSMRAMMDMMYVMVGMLVAAAIILGVVVLYNMGVLSMVEKMREMATLKVLGFDTAKIRSILLQQNIWITLLGVIVGIPCGKELIVLMFADMPDAMDYSVELYFSSYVITFVGTFAISMLVNRILSRKVAHIDMVDALKGQE